MKNKPTPKNPQKRNKARKMAKGKSGKMLSKMLEKKKAGRRQWASDLWRHQMKGQELKEKISFGEIALKTLDFSKKV